MVNTDFVRNTAQDIRSRLDKSLLPNEDLTELFDLYALLAVTLGERVTERDVHAAWCVWMRGRNDKHHALVPFDSLNVAAQKQDEPFVSAIRGAAAKLKPSRDMRIERELFHSFTKDDDLKIEHRFEQYKMMVDSSERLVARRQGVNTFFLTANGAIIASMGLLIRAGGSVSLKALGVGVLAFAALVLCVAWASLLTSFGRLNAGKFAVINRIERTLPLGLYSAEWEALERGEDPKIYKSFTEREGWVPRVLIVLYAVVIVAAITVAVIYSGG